MLCFTRLKTNFHKLFQFFWWTRNAGTSIGDVNLCDFGPSALSAICDVKGDEVIEIPCGSVRFPDCKIRKTKRRVRQSETEREEWFRTVAFITAISNENPFLVGNPLGAAFRVIIGKRGTVFLPLLNSYQQMPRWT